MENKPSPCIISAFMPSPVSRASSWSSHCPGRCLLTTLICLPSSLNCDSAQNRRLTGCRAAPPLHPRVHLSSCAAQITWPRYYTTCPAVFPALGGCGFLMHVTGLTLFTVPLVLRKAILEAGSEYTRRASLSRKIRVGEG